MTSATMDETLFSGAGLATQGQSRGSDLRVVRGKFYHFTSALHLPHILRAGYLRPTESNVSLYRPHAGPDVVWLLDEPVPDYGHGLNLGIVDKTEIRFTVDVPAIKWTDWQWSVKDTESRDVLISTGGGLEAAEHWYIWPRPIDRNRWSEIRNMETGEVIIP